MIERMKAEAQSLRNEPRDAYPSAVWRSMQNQAMMLEALAILLEQAKA